MRKAVMVAALVAAFLLVALRLFADAAVPATGVQAFSYYCEAESFQGVASTPTNGQWGQVAGSYFGGLAIQDNGTATQAATYTFNVPANGTYYLWMAHRVATNQYTSFACSVVQNGTTVTNLEYATVLATPAQDDTNYVYRPGTWEAWSVRPVALKEGPVTLQLTHSAGATGATWVDAVQIVGESLFTPDWNATGSKPFSYFVEATTFDGVTNSASPGWSIGAASGTFTGYALWKAGGTAPATHTLTVPKAGTYYLWIFHETHPTYYPAFGVVFQQSGLTVTSLTYGAQLNILNGTNWANPYYYWQPGYWTAWERQQVTLPAGSVQIQLTKSPLANLYLYVDALHLVDDPNYVPDLLGGSYYKGTYFPSQIPEFQFRVMIDSIAPPQANWYYLSFQSSIPLQPLTVGGWSSWFSMTGAVQQAFLSHSSSGWPARFGFTMYPYYKTTNMTLTIQWQTSMATGSFTTVYSGSTNSYCSFNLLQWRLGRIPTPLQTGPVSAYNQKYLRIVNSLGLTTNDVPKQFAMVDRFIGLDGEDQAWHDGLTMLHTLGMNVIQAEGYPSAKSYLAQLGVTKTGRAIYVPPLIFDTDLSQTSPSAMNAWAAGQATNVMNSGWNPQDVGWFALSDEPGWYYPHMYNNPGPDLVGVFQTYLQNKGFSAADFGLADWSQLSFIGQTAATNLPSKRLFYWTQRFFPENSANVFARWVRALEGAFYGGMPLSVNWNSFNGRHYSPGAWGNNPDKTSPDAATGFHDWIDFGRQRATTALWTEDWFSDTYARLWSFYTSRLRSGDNHYNNSMTNGAPPAITFGGYVIGATAGAVPGGTLQKVLSILGNGGKLINFYVFGPEYTFPGNCWSENTRFYPELASALRIVGQAEDLMYPGKPVPAQVAILMPESAQAWDGHIGSPGGGSFNDNSVDYMAEVYNLYTALADSHVPTDWVDETDLENNALGQFKVIYVTTPNLSTNAIAGLQQWIQSGGVAVFTAGAGQFDIYNETNTTLNATLGIAAAPHDRLFAPAHTNQLGTVTSSVGGLSNFIATGLAQSLSPTTASTQATFASSGQPAITMNAVGSGQAIVFGTLVGTAYQVGGQVAARGWVTWPVTVAGVVLPADFNAPKVEAETLQSTHGLAVTLLNWSGNTVSNIALTVNSSRTVGLVQSVQLGAALPFTQIGGVVTFTLPVLGPADVVKVYATMIAPTTLSASPASDNQIGVSWTDASDNEQGFRIERSADGVSGWTEVGTVGANVASWLDGGLAKLTAYYYRVRAYNGGEYTAYSNVAHAQTLAGPAALTVDNADATGVSITGAWTVDAPAGCYGPNELHDGNTGKGTKSVRFTPTLPAAGSYQVYLRWTTAANRASNVPVDVVSASGTTTVTVNQQLNGAQWNLLGTYSFAAGTAGSVLVRTGGTGGYVIADAVRWVFNSPPATPSGLNATAPTDNLINLTWTDNAVNEDGFKIERSPDGVSYGQIGTAGSNATSYADDTVSALTTYFYRVRAYNSLGGNSDYSNVATVTTAAQMTVSPATNNFGSFLIGQSSSLAFQVRNTGNVTISGTASLVTAGTPFTILSGTPFTVAVGGSTNVVVRFGPVVAGVYSNRVAFTSNGGIRTNLVLGTGLAFAQLATSPATNNFGGVLVGQSSNLAFQVSNTGSVTLSGTASLVVTGAPFAILGGTPFTVAGGASTNVTVRFSPLGAGPFSDGVVLASNGGTRTNAVLGSGLALAQLTVNPATNNFGGVAIGQSSNLAFQVSNTGSVTLSGTASLVTTGTPFGIVSGTPFTVTGGSSTNVVVSFSPPSGGPFSNRVGFASNGGTRTNAVGGTGLTAGHIGVIPASLDFGYVPTGSTTLVTLVITNTGGVAVTNGTAAVSSPYSIQSAMPFTVPGFGTANVTVRFAPPSLMTFIDNVHVNTANGGSTNVPVRGVGSIRPVACFSASPTNGPVALPVLFTDCSTGPITNRQWSFGNGAISNSTATSLTYTYGAAGTNTVRLIVSGPMGVDTNTQANLVVVLQPAQMLVSPATNNFGSVWVGQSSNRAFLVSNTGSVSLIGAAGLLAGGSPFGIVSGTPFTVAGGRSANVVVRFSPAGAGPFSNRVGFVSNGGSQTNAVLGTGLAPGQIAVTPAGVDFGYVLTGATAQATLVITNTGAVAVTNGTATVNPPFSIRSGSNFLVAAYGSTNVAVRFAPVGLGTYNDRVVINSANGGQTNVTVTGVGAIKPAACFSASPTNGLASLPVAFADCSTGTVTNRAWRFGDGGTSSAANPSHTYTNAGLFTVSLTVFGPGGSNTLNRTNCVAVSSPLTNQDVRDFLAAAKLQYFDQAGDGAPAQSVTGFAFHAEVTGTASNSVTSVTDRVPGGAVKTLVPNEASNEFSFSQYFTTAAGLDTAYSNGVYALTIATAHSGSIAPALSLTSNAYPNVPRILNYGAAQAINPTVDFTITWTNFVGGTANDFISFELEDAMNRLVVQSPDFAWPGHWGGTATVYRIAAGSLGTCSSYRGRLLFLKITARDTNSIAGAVGITGYGVQTTFNLGTISGDLWSGAADLGGGWKWFDWFGYFNTTYDPWINHLQHGWLYPCGADTNSICFWDNTMAAWWWTSATTYPYCYRFSDSSWLWYQKDSVNPRWFYNLTAGNWESW